MEVSETDDELADAAARKREQLEHWNSLTDAEQLEALARAEANLPPLGAPDQA